MNKSAFARELGSQLGVRMTRQMLDKYHVRGMPLNSVDSAIEWLRMNSVGKPGRRAGEVMKRGGGPQVATPRPPTATLQPDDCGLEVNPFLTAEDGASFYEPQFAEADITELSRLLQRQFPAAARAIRETICRWTGSACCPRCRRAVGIVDPPEPDHEAEARAA